MSEKAKHTPPTVKSLRTASDYTLAEIRPGDKVSLAELRAVADAYRAERAESDRINADLLAALEEAKANVERVTDGGRTAVPDLQAWLRRARAAIAKARGEGAERERDEARAEVERLRGALAGAANLKGISRKRFRIWERINEYAEACGGDTSPTTVSDRRMRAVVAVESALAAERAHADAERESLREALRVKHKALERLTYLYESEQDTEALERVERPGWLRVALSRLRLSIQERAADGEKPYRRHATRQNGDCADWCRACEDEARARAALAGEASGEASRSDIGARAQEIGRQVARGICTGGQPESLHEDQIAALCSTAAALGLAEGRFGEASGPKVMTITTPRSPVAPEEPNPYRPPVMLPDPDDAMLASLAEEASGDVCPGWCGCMEGPTHVCGSRGCASSVCRCRRDTPEKASQP